MQGLKFYKDPQKQVHVVSRRFDAFCTGGGKSWKEYDTL